MSFTMIGCGDLQNQDREKGRCPRTQPPDSVSKYAIQMIGDPDPDKTDYTHLDDFANFLVATLLESAKRHDAFLNVVSDTISHSQIARLLGQYSGKQLELDVMGEEKMHEIWDDQNKAPKEHTQIASPVDLRCLVKGTQGKGAFVRPKSQIHDGLYPALKYTSFEGYSKARFDSTEKLNCRQLDRV